MDGRERKRLAGQHGTHNLESENLAGKSCRKNDAMQFLRVFPEELWLLILANVQDANDYLRLFGASLFFRERSSSKRLSVMLTAVVQILLCRPEHWKWTRDYRGFKDDDPRITLNNLAASRGVCRDWRKGIERGLHNMSYNYKFFEELTALEYEFSRFVCHTEKVFKYVTNWTSIESHYFDSHFATKANPFLTRAIIIELPVGDRDCSQFIRSCLNVLRTYGKHVWYLQVRELTGSNIGPTATEISQFLKDLFQELPNLKVLRFNIRSPVGIADLFECQLPALRKLIYLDLIFRFGQETQFDETCDTDHFCDAGKVLKACFQLSATIPKLKIDFDGTQLLWNGIITELENYTGAENLTSLSLSLSSTDLFANGRELELPNLKTLILKVRAAVPLDFLLGMRKTLKDLRIIMNNSKTFQMLVCAETPENRISFYNKADLGQLYLSNIWEMLPNLQNVAISGHQEIYTWRVLACAREEWKDKCRSKNTET